MLLVLLLLGINIWFTNITYKLLSKNKFKKVKPMYIILNAIYYLISLIYIFIYMYVTSYGIVINGSIYVFLKLSVVISFMFDMSLELSMYTNVKKFHSQSKKTPKSKKKG